MIESKDFEKDLLIMPRTDAQRRADAKYRKCHIKRVPLDLKMDDYTELQEAAANNGESVNGFIKAAIKERIERLHQKK